MTGLNLPKYKTYSRTYNLLTISIILKRIEISTITLKYIHPYDKLTCVISDHGPLLLEKILLYGIH